MVQKIVTIFVIIGAIVVSEINGQSADKYCLSNSECGKGECCLLGPGGFSQPICVSRVPEGGDCRPNNNPISKTADDKSGNKFTLTNVHEIVCPCLEGLHCNMNDGGKCRA